MTSQIKVKEMRLSDVGKPIRKPRTINGHSFQIYLEYDVFLLTTDSNCEIFQDDIQVLAADVGRFYLILRRS